MVFRSIPWVRCLLAALILVAGPAFVARAQIVQNFTEPVPGIPGKTWLDLMGRVFTHIEVSKDPDIAATASDFVDKVHSIGGADESWISCGDQIKIVSLEVYTLRLAGYQRVVVAPSLADQCAAVVALFDDKGELIDVVNLKGDQHGGLGANFLTPLGPDGPVGPPGALVTATNSHDNSDQSYDATILVLVKPNGFSAIGEVLAFGSHTCRRQFTEETRVGTSPVTGPMRRIDAAITRETQRFAADCETKTGRETVAVFNGHWHWNAEKGAYDAHTSELDLLDKWNRKQD
jgi:hypothetical protein